MTKPRVLVVDDDPINLKTLIGLLEHEFELAAAINGKVGLQAAERTVPDLILLDITMPDMDGYAVLRALKQRKVTRDIPVIFITGLNSAEDEAKGLEHGASDYISKPFNPTVVKARVNTQLRLKQQSDQLALNAIQDGLTHVANRQHIETLINRAIVEGSRTGQCLGLLMIDIDQFKRFNQIYGNDYGDATLKVISRLLQNKLITLVDEKETQASDAKLRTNSALGRFEGDSFLMFLPQADEQTLALLAADIQIAISDLRIPNTASKHKERLTVSQGYISVVPNTGTRVEQLLEYTHLAVSAAKRHGGNRVIVQQPSERIYWDRESL
jgi:diguanylate cyclase (GGDEF)-like protein